MPTRAMSKPSDSSKGVSMKPERKTDFVPRLYWTCTVSTHRHTSPSTAEKCIFNATRPKRVENKWNKTEYKKIIALRDSGLTLRECGAHYGVCAQHARYTIEKARRLIARQEQSNDVKIHK